MTDNDLVTCTIQELDSMLSTLSIVEAYLKKGWTKTAMDELLQSELNILDSKRHWEKFPGYKG